MLTTGCCHAADIRLQMQAYAQIESHTNASACKATMKIAANDCQQKHHGLRVPCDYTHPYVFRVHTLSRQSCSPSFGGRGLQVLHCHADSAARQRDCHSGGSCEGGSSSWLHSKRGCCSFRIRFFHRFASALGELHLKGPCYGEVTEW